MGKGTFLVILPTQALRSSQTTFQIGLYSEGVLIETQESSFVGPSSLD